MKQCATTLLVLLVFSQLVYSQHGWVQIDASFPNLDWMDVDFYDANFGITVGVEGKIKRTLDGGSNWEFVQSGVALRLNAVNIATSEFAVVVGYEGTVLKSTNSGATWTDISLPNFAETLLDVQFFNETTGYVFGSKSNVWKTTDGGTTWTQQDPKFSNNNVWSVHGFDEENLAICGNGGNIGRTTNGGDKWIGQSSPWSQELYSISFADSSYGYCVGTMATIMKTVDGGETWETIDPGMPLPSYPMNHVQMFDRNNIHMCGWSGLSLATNDGGVNWAIQDLPQELVGIHLESLDFVTPKLGFMVGWHGTILKTVDGGGGLSVEDITTIPSSLSINGVYPNPVRAQTQASVQFSLPAASETAVTVFNLLGAKVASVNPQRLEAGSHSIALPVHNLVPGVYVVRVSNATSIRMKTFNIVR